MTQEENTRRSKDEHVKFIKQNICDKNSDKSFVFISYKSDDWETVLNDVVYRLVKDYGLNVYFDGSFDSHNSLWITQFPENMKDYKCRGVISFIDDKYITSYATLMELMCSQTLQADKPVIPINLENLSVIDGKEGNEDTGLGNEDNVNAGQEKILFERIFSELIERHILNDAKFLYDLKDESRKLTKKTCSNIMKELIGYLKVNENKYNGTENSLDGIVATIKNTCGEEVFSTPVKNNGIISNTVQPVTVEVQQQQPEMLQQSTVLQDMSGNVVQTVQPVVATPIKMPKKKSSGYFYTFSYDDVLYENTKLKEMMLTVFKQLIGTHFDRLDAMIDYLPCLGEGNRISRDAVPSVFKAGEAVQVNGRIVSIGTSLSEKAVLDYIGKALYLCEERDGIFKIVKKVPKDIMRRSFGAKFYE